MQTGVNQIADYLLKAGLEVNRDNYLSLAHCDVPLGEWNQEMLAEWEHVKQQLGLEH
jgi:hypothetical protein